MYSKRVYNKYKSINHEPVTLSASESHRVSRKRAPLTGICTIHAAPDRIFLHLLIMTLLPSCWLLQ